MGYKIAELRRNKNMSQEELAEKSGISRATISYMENGDSRNASSKTLRAIASALGTTIDGLFLSETSN